MTEEPFHLIDLDGRIHEDRASQLDLKEAELLELYELMSMVRRADLEATALQRQGELAVYPPLLGQEAAQVGSAYALAPGDFVFPSYRELGAAVVRGIDLVDYLAFYRGTWHGGNYDLSTDRFGMVAVPIASQIPHAMGFALGSKLDGHPTVTMVYFGDGATSQGDFHEGCNFASVFKVPLVLLCQNNGWAISVPVSQQTAAPIYSKAAGYGMPGILVDGNDVLATYLVTKQAVDRARAGEGPTLIEAVTYRMGPHSTADDAGRYQPADEVAEWRSRDPLARYRKYLETEGLLDEAVQAGVERKCDDLATHIRGGVVGAPPPPLTDLFAWVFSEPSPHLDRQREELLSEAEGHDA